MKNLTVKELINYYSGKLYENNLLKVFVFNSNYSDDDLITDINSVLNNIVKSYDVWDYDEFMFMFCNEVDSIYFATHFNQSTRFITIKI